MLNQTYLERASCRGTNFHNADLTQATFEYANCTYANFNGAITAGIKAKHAQGMY
jgi:uncharacterized protein YjbI with pentapeptide repeats